MKNAWLRWIRGDEGSIDQFLMEVGTYGAALRVSLRDLSHLSWGDDVYCVRKPIGGRGGVVFAKFPLRIVTGLSQEGVDALKEGCGMDEIMPAGNAIDRRFASYTEGSTYSVNANIQEVAEALKSATSGGSDIGLVMVACYKGTVETLDLPWPILVDVENVMGLRRFDAPEFMADLIDKDSISAGRFPGKYATHLKPKDPTFNYQD